MKTHNNDSEVKKQLENPLGSKKGARRGARCNPTNQTEIDEILSEFDIWCKYGHNECVKYDNFREAAQAIEEYATQKAVEELEEIFNLFGVPQCNHLHHPKKYQHTALEDCPVEHRLALLRKDINATKS